MVSVGRRGKGRVSRLRRGEFESSQQALGYRDPLELAGMWPWGDGGQRNRAQSVSA